MKILLLTDDSPNAGAAARTLCGRAYSSDSMVRVVSVFDDLLPQRLSRKEAENSVAAALDVLEKCSFAANVTGEIVQGNPVKQILSLSETWQPDIIVLGAHARRDPLSDVLHENVAGQVLKHAPTTVLMVRADGLGQSYPEKRHLICVNDPAKTAQILSNLEREVANPAAEFMFMHVLEEPDEPGSENPRQDALILQSRLKEMRVKKEAMLAECIAFVHNSLPGCSVDSRIVEDSVVVENILDFAKSWHSNVIVLGSHQQRDSETFFLDSVPRAVCLGAHCSVEIVF